MGGTPDVLPIRALLRVTALAAGGLVLAGVWPAARTRGWPALWPVPLMAIAATVGVLDVAALAGPFPVNVAPGYLALEVCAAAVVTVVGGIEIGAWRRPHTDDWRALLAPAVLSAFGLAALIGAAPAAAEANPPSSVLFGVLLLLAGLTFLAARLASTASRLPGYVWPVLLMATAGIDLGSARPTDAWAQARSELAGLTAAWRRAGFRVVLADSTLPDRRASGNAELRHYRVDGHEVRVYLFAHEPLSAAADHLAPHVPAPPVAHGVPARAPRDPEDGAVSAAAAPSPLARRAASWDGPEPGGQPSGLIAVRVPDPFSGDCDAEVCRISPVAFGAPWRPAGIAGPRTGWLRLGARSLGCAGTGAWVDPIGSGSGLCCGRASG
jgi:hypothetical protein